MGFDLSGNVLGGEQDYNDGQNGFTSITSRLVEERDVEAFQLPTSRSQAPRFGGGTLFYLSSRDGADGLWSYRDGKALEIWKGSAGALQSPAAVSADGNGVAFAVTREGTQQIALLPHNTFAPLS